MLWFVIITSLFFGAIIGAMLMNLWHERNEIGVLRRDSAPNQRISKLDLFELPDSMRSPEKKDDAPPQ